MPWSIRRSNDDNDDFLRCGFGSDIKGKAWGSFTLAYCMVWFESGTKISLWSIVWGSWMREILLLIAKWFVRVGIFVRICRHIWIVSIFALSAFLNYRHSLFADDNGMV